MVIIRKWDPATLQLPRDQRKVLVDSFVIVRGSEEEQLQAVAEAKANQIVDPLFVSFTVLKFVSETRKLEEPEAADKSKIVIPTSREVRKFSRSKYQPGG